MLADLRYALLQLVKRPGFTVIVVATLALGIGANTAIFSVMDGVLLRPTPFSDVDRLTMIWETDRNTGTVHEPGSVPDYLDFRDRATAFSSVAALLPREVVLTPDGGDPFRLAAVQVSDDYLPMVGIGAVRGRGFVEGDDRIGAPDVAVISQSLWERRFGGDEGVVGRTIVLNDRPVTVVGVLPDGADFGTLQVLNAADYQRSFADRGEAVEVDVWLPLRPDPEALPRSTHPIFMVGKLAPGATLASASEEMTTIAAALEATYPENDARGVHLQTLKDVVFGPIRPALVVLLAAVALVLLVACANVANLLLARGTTRFREVAVRTALGADTRRLARQFVIEGILLGVISGLVGVSLAIWGTDALLAIAPTDVPRLADVGVNATVLAVTASVALTVGVLFGLVPTFQSRTVDLQSALKGESRGTVSAAPGRSRLRAGLVVAQLAIAVVLVVGAALLLRSFWQLQHVDAGFRAQGVLKAEFVLPTTRYPVDFSVWPDFKEIHRFNADLLDRVERINGVEAAAIAGNHPLDAGFTNSFVIVGREAESADFPEISIRRVTPGYFATVGLEVRKGRPLGSGDGTYDPPTVLINETAAREFFPDGSAIGQQIRFWGTNRTIVGITADEKFHGIAAQAPVALYAPYAQAPGTNGAETLLVRATGDPMMLASAVRSAVRAIDPGLAVYGIEPLTRTLARSLAQQRFTMLLLGVFAVVALTLAVLGVHGVLSYMVARRVPEVGVRVALGATRGDVVGLVLREGMRLTLAGLGIGVIGALIATRALRSLLYGITAVDVGTYIVVVVIVSAVALAASWIPARRATGVDPMEALRVE